MNPFKNVLADQWASQTNYIIIKDTDDIEELERQYQLFLSQMTVRQQRLSDDRSIEIWNMTNKQHYEAIKSKLMAKIDKEYGGEDNQDTYSYEYGDQDTNIQDKDLESILNPTISDEEESIKEDNSIPITADNKSDIPLPDHHPLLNIPYNDKRQKETQADQYEIDQNIFIIGTIKGTNREENLQDLEKQWINFNSQSHDHRKKSDDKCRELFGMSNLDRYNALKAKYLSHTNIETDHKIEPTENHGLELKNDEVKLEFVSQVYQNMLTENKQNLCNAMKHKRLTDTPYFTPQELIDLGVHRNHNWYSDEPDNDGLINTTSVTTWFDSYKDMFERHVFEDYRKEWIETVTKLYSDFERIKELGDTDRINARKQSILDLGWNPEIPFTRENRRLATKRINEAMSRVPEDIYIDMTGDIDDNEVIEEVVSLETHKPVFLIFIEGSIPIVSKGISYFTDSVFTHAALSFDSSMERIHSYAMSPEKFGFVRESIRQYKKDKVSIMVFFAPNKTVDMMKDKLVDFGSHHTRYDMDIIFRKMIHKDEKLFKSDYRQVCSTFVDNILKAGQINLSDGINLPDPGQLYTAAKSRPNTITEVYYGPANEYDQKKVDKKIKKLLSKSNLLGIDESVSVLKEDYYSRIDEWRAKYGYKIDRYQKTVGEKCVERFSVSDEDKSIYQGFTKSEQKYIKPVPIIDENTYVFSDPHFTKVSPEYDKYIIDMINSVPKSATLLILGDIGYMKTEDTNHSKIIKDYFNTIKHPNMYLILGNHDVHTIQWYYSLGFKGVYDRIVVEEKKWTFSHQPTEFPSADYTNFHGHIHEETKYTTNLTTLDNKINCWVGYCNGKIKTINEWIRYSKNIRKSYLIENVCFYDEVITEASLPTEYSLRPATKEDSENMYNWEIESVDKKIQNDPKVKKYIEKDVQDSIKNTKMIMYKDETIGMITACPIDGGEYWYIGEIYVTKEHRGKGIGTNLLKDEISKHDKIKLQIAESNTKAKKLYESLGFKEKELEHNKDGHMYVMVLDKTSIDESVSDLPSSETNDVYHNMELWESGVSNLLWITGLSGSGKSTLSADICKEYNAVYVELDDLQRMKMDNWSSSGCEVIDSYVQHVGGIKNIFPYCNSISDIKWKDIVCEESHCEKEFNKFFDYMIEYAKHHTNKRFVCEGVQIAYCSTDTMIKKMSSYPIIVKMNGPLKAEFRREKRLVHTGIEKNDSLINIFKRVNRSISNWIKQDFYRKDWDEVNYYRQGIGESTLLVEMKQFPVEFDKEGNLIIYKARIGSLSYGDEVNDSVQLLESYRNTNNIEGMKYELAKLWFINDQIEKQLKKRLPNDKYKELIDTRAICLNVFKTNLEYVLKAEKGFNFSNYYNSTPFSDNSVKITASTIHYTASLIKSMI